MTSDKRIRTGMLCTAFVVQSIFVFGQSIRFSEVFNHPNSGAGILEGVVVTDDDNLVVIGNSLNFSSGLRDAHHLIIDGEGSFLNEVSLETDSFEINPQAIIRSHHGGGFYTSGYWCNYLSTSPGPCDFYISKLNELGDTLFTSIIERPDTSDFLLSMVETRPNKIMLIGWTYDDTTDVNADLLFITVDTLGNELNRVVYGGGGVDYVRASIVIDELGSVLMTGYTASFHGSDNDTWLIQTDSMGNVQWSETYNHLSSSGGDAGSAIVKTLDGNYVLAGSFAAGAGETDNYIMKVDNVGTEIWTKRYEIPENQGFWNGYIYGNGEMLFVGQTTYTDDDSQAGWLVKTDENGDTLWTRTYNPSDNTDLLRNMLVMPNGDIVMVGFGRDENSTTQDGWLLRVDSMGCLEEGCHLVGVNELEERESLFHLFPNPATSEIQLRFNDLSIQGLEVIIRDILGKEIVRLNPQSNKKSINVSAWSRGIYSCSVHQEKQLVKTKKLVLTE